MIAALRRTLPLLALATGVATAAPPSADVTEIEAGAVRAAFAEGRPLVENDAYKIHASRRVAAGQAEVHVRDTDVIHVLEGEATLVTGGAGVGGAETAPGEIRGDSIEGGVARTLAPGDVIVVPNGVPHWFREVRGPVLYYVVKVTAAEPAR